MANDDVLIIGKLEDSDLKNSINELVNYVDNQTTVMAGSFTKSMEIMKEAMKDFAITQKVSVDLMKKAWKDMGASFDAMYEGERRGTGGGGGSGKPTYPDNTVGALEQEIALLKKERKEMELFTDDLKEQNAKLEERKRLLKDQTTAKPKTVKEVMGMDANSLEEITQKMRALKRVQIDPNNAAQVKQLGDEYQRLKRLQAELMGMNIQHTKSNNYLAQSFGYIRNRIVYALTLGAVTNFTKQLYEIRGQYELLERSLGVLLNSFERGTQVFQELNKMAIESPFTLMELAGGAKQLSAYNFAAKEVVDTTRRLADISAALGVPMERLVYNLGQIRAQTRLTARDARDFANAGLPIVSALADRYSDLEGKIVTTGDVYDRMTKKMVSYNDVMSVINEMTDAGGKFFDFQAKQAETLRVQMANLTLAWNNMLNAMGERDQTLLSAPVKALKALLQNWESLNRVFKNVIISLGLLRVAQVIAIRNNWKLGESAVGAARMMGTFANAIKGFYASLKVMALNPWTWIFVGIFALTDLIGKMRAASRDTAELNDEIRNAANEAAENTNKFLVNKGNAATRKLAQENKLSAEQGEKAWEQLREQIEQSAMSSDNLIGRLLEIENINERVRKGFDYTENINKAAYALSKLGEDDIVVTHDQGWFGMFGEGLVSDLKDYGEELKNFKGTYQDFLNIVNTSVGNNNPLKINYKEFQSELKETAESIKNFLDANNIKDPLQINEILERVRAKIKEKNPEIKGEMARVFDIELDKQMSEMTNGAVDANASLWKIFMDRLKHQSSATFQGITDDWVKSSDKLSKQQQEAVDENLEYFKKSMPFAYDAIAKMVADASKLKIQIGVAFNVQSLSDFQKEVNKRIKNKYGQIGSDRFKGLLPQDQDNLDSFVKTQQEAIAKLEESNKKYRKDDTDWSKKKIQDNDTEIAQRKELLDLFNQSYKKEKNTSSHKQKDVLGDALKKEVDLIDNIQKRYKEYEKMGVDTQTAITKATDEYGTTLKNVGAILRNYGIKTKSGEELAGMNVRDVRDYLKTLLTYAQALKNEKGIEAIEKSIAKLNVEITKTDYKKITDGLNNELSKLKSDYELAIELDANPELGGMFLDMFGIDSSDFSHNIDDYMFKVQSAFEKARRELGYGVTIDVFKANAEEWRKWGEWVGLSGEALDNFKAKFVSARDVVKKWAQDVVKQTQDLQYKLADNNGKIAIEEEKLANLKILLANEVNEKQKRLLELQIQDQQNAINKLKEELLQLLPTYQRVFGEVAEHSAWMTRKLAKDYKNMLVEGQKRGLNPDNTYSVTDPISGQIARISKERMGKEIKNADKELQKTQGTIKKITEAFKKGEDGVVDWVHGIELIGEELEKMGQLVDVVGNIADAFSNPNEYNATSEAIHDIATSMQGISTATKGIGQIASGDYIGGALNVASGLFSAISTWFDNGDKEILQQIKDSERAVKRLEIAYVDLQHAMDEAYGTAEIGAQRAIITNKELQLVELKRQLQLEKSRKAKNRDEDRILELKKQIKELEYDIVDSIKEITNSLLGISSVGNAAETLVTNMIAAFKKGEDFMTEYAQTFDDMIDNMIMKAIVSNVIGNRLQEMFDRIQSISEERAEAQRLAYEQAAAEYDKIQYLSDKGFIDEYYYFDPRTFNVDKTKKITKEEQDKLWRERLEFLKKQYEAAMTPTPEDVESIRDDMSNWRESVKEEFLAYMDAFGIKSGQDATNTLSALQQGIQGVTETTAGAIEAYMNSISQQIYLQSDLLTQIRDAVVAFDTDLQSATLGEILLQLRSSYEMQMAIHSMMEGWTTPSGNGIRVELIS